MDVRKERKLRRTSLYSLVRFLGQGEWGRGVLRRSNKTKTRTDEAVEAWREEEEGTRGETKSTRRKAGAELGQDEAGDGS